VTDKFYDNTRCSAMKGCPRKFYFRHRLHWTPDISGPALVFGSAWHNAMDVVWTLLAADPGRKTAEIAQAGFAAFLNKWEEEGMTPYGEMGPDEIAKLGARHPGTAAEMLYSYIDTRRAMFQSKSFELISVEQPFAVPLDPNLPNLFYVGRIDKVFKYQGDILVGEHKTTAMYSKAAGFRSSWIDSFSPNSQIDGYMYAARMTYGDKVRAIWVDGALVHKTEHDVFKFIPIERKWEQLDAWLWETRYWIDQIEANDAILEHLNPDSSTPYLPAFPKNTGECATYSGCTYMDLCKAWANPIGKPLPGGFRKEKWSPFEVLELNKLGLEQSK